MKKTSFLFGVAVVCMQALLAQENVLNETDKPDTSRSELSVGISFGAGAALIRNIIAPKFELGLIYTRGSKYALGISGSSSFFFEKNAPDKYSTYINTFLNLQYYWNGKNPTRYLTHDYVGWQGIGVGYLINAQGDYFFGNTFKLFYTIALSKHIEAGAELYFTDDFKSIFPGISILIN